MDYRLTQLTPSKASVIELDSAKGILRVDDDVHDDRIKDIILAVRDYCEGYTRRIFRTTQFVMKSDNFPCSDSGYFILPRSPLISVDSIKYYDSDGTLQTLSSSAYETDDGIDVPARVYLLPDETFPTLQTGRRNAVEITFTCGYLEPGSASKELVPQLVQQAMRYMITHYFENDIPVIIGQTANVVPMTVTSLLNAFRIAAGANT